MPVWKYKLGVVDVFRDWHDRSFEERRNEVVRRIEKSDFYQDEWSHELERIKCGLAEAEDFEDFDQVWNWFYDWADEVRVWVKTF